MNWAATHGKIKPKTVNEFNKASKGLDLPKFVAPKSPAEPKVKKPKTLKFNFLDKIKEFK